MKIIGFGILSWHLLYFLGPSIAPLILEIVYRVYKPEEDFSHVLVFAYVFDSIGETLIGLLDFIKIFHNPPKQHSHTEVLQTAHGFSSLSITDEKPTQWYFLVLPLFGFIDFIFFFLLRIPITVVNTWGFILTKITTMLTLSLFCSVFLRFKYNRHHLFSFIILLSGFIFLVCATYDEECIVSQLLIRILVSIIYNLHAVYEKWVMNHYSISVYRIILIEGLTEMLLAFISLAVLRFIPCTFMLQSLFFCNAQGNYLTFEALYELISSNEILYFSLRMVVNSISTAFNKLIIYHYSPTHPMVANILIEVFVKIITSIYIGIWYQIVLQSIGIIVVFFGTMFYNELIVLYMCGLEHETRTEIIKRSNDELKQTDLLIAQLDNEELVKMP